MTKTKTLKELEAEAAEAFAALEELELGTYGTWTMLETKAWAAARALDAAKTKAETIKDEKQLRK